MMLAAAMTAVALMCHGQHAPLTPEQERQQRLEWAAEARAHYGFRSDAAYVEALARRGRWRYEMPVTRAEARYLRLRDRIRLGDRAYRYLRRQRDLSGGTSIEDDWPREPYVLVRLTRDRARHRAALRRLVRFPENLRTVEVAHSERELRALAHRIGRDSDELEAAGFQLSTWGADVDTNTVEVELITARTDHAQYFAQRYGPVTTQVIATEPTYLECTETDAYGIASDGRSLVLHYGTGGGAKLETVELTEHADRVEVGIVERAPHGFRTLERRSARAPVALSAPLGDRAVIDAATGQPLRLRGPRPGDPPCPRVRETSNLEHMIQRRRERGLRHGRAYVRRMLRREIPFTDAEQRFLDTGDLLRSDRVDGYLRRHRDEHGGTDIAGRFPGEPVLVVRVTRRLAFHRRNLERLVDGRVRVVASRFAEAELERVERRVERAVEAGRGFVDDMLVLVARIDAGRVVVQVVTRRDDYAAALRARYGPAVKAVRVGTRPECELDPLGPRVLRARTSTAAG